MDEEYEVKIHVTDEYDRFKKMLGNRDTKGVAKIVESIQAIGQVKEPIIVNENYEIIDGQNRLEAYKQLSLPVYYMVLSGLDIQACRHLNIGQTNWGIDDWILSYAEGGNENYRRLASLMTSYKKRFSLEGIFALANPLTVYDSGARARDRVRPGKYILSAKEYDQAVKRLSTAEDVGLVDVQKNRKFDARTYWGAVSYLFLNPTISVEQAAAKIIERQAVIPGTKSVSEQLRFFDDAINMMDDGSQKKKQGVFLYADFTKRLYMDEKYAF